MAGELLAANVTLLHRLVNGRLGLNPVPVNDTGEYLFNLPMTGGGRFGFVEDVLWTDVSGDTFVVEVARTQGSAGATTIEILQDGVKIGEVDFAHNQMGRKPFTVTGPAATGMGQVQTNISLRIKDAVPATARLHRSESTICEIILDDGSEDPNAIWLEGAQSTNGDGSKSQPFNRMEHALAAVNAANGSVRNVYVIGDIPKADTMVYTTVGDNTTENTLCFHIPGQSSEANRLWIRKAPGALQATIDCGYSTSFFHADRGDEASFVTFYGFNVSNVGVEAITENGVGATGTSEGYAGAIQLNYANGVRTHAYAVNVNGVTGGIGSNTTAFHFYGSVGCNTWNCSGRDIKLSADGAVRVDNANCCFWQAYDGESGSVTHCFMTDVDVGIYQKAVIAWDRDSYTARFNIVDTPNVGVELNVDGIATDKPSYAVIEQNIIKNQTVNSFSQGTRNLGTHDGYRNWFVNNVVIRSTATRGDTSFFFSAGLRESVIFNNLVIDTAVIFKVNAYYEVTGDPAILHSSNDSFQNARGDNVGNKIYFQNVVYRTIEDFFAATGLGANSEEVVLDFIDTVDYKLAANAPQLTNGIGGTPRGAYITQSEIIGLLQ